jgi:hypothetical protein
VIVAVRGLDLRDARGRRQLVDRRAAEADGSIELGRALPRQEDPRFGICPAGEAERRAQVAAPAA